MENSEERKGEASAEKIGMSTKDRGENISKKEKGWELESPQTLDQWSQELDNSKVGPHLALEISYISTYVRASLVARMEKNPPAMPETQL